MRQSQLQREMLYNLIILLIVLALCIADGRPKAGPPKFKAWTENSTDLILMAPEKGYVVNYYGSTMNLTAQLYVDLNQYPGATVSIKINKTEIVQLEGELEITECVVEHLANYTVSLPSTTEANIVNSTIPNGRQTALPVSYEEKYQTSANLTCIQIHMRVSPVFLGRSNGKFDLQYVDPETGRNMTRSIADVLFTCTRYYRIVDWAFRICIYTMVGVATFAMGSDINLPNIKKHMKKPKAPLIALFSQYTFMPLLSYAIIRLMNYKGAFAFGLFLLGCSPGGGASNMYSKLVNGDMSISVTMTAISTFASIGMLPFWVYTLGSTIPGSDELGKITIPYLSLLQSLAIVVVPILLGILVQFKLPKVAKVIKKCLKIFFLMIILFLLTVGIYSNLYIYISFNARLIFSSALIPYGGYICGGLLAWAFRLNWKLIKTIIIETGMQNIGIAILVLQSSLESPEVELALIPLIATAFMTTSPFYIGVPIYLLYQKCYVKKKEGDEGDELEEASEEDMEKFNKEGVEKDGSERGSSNSSDVTKQVSEQEMEEIPERTKLV